MKWSIGLVATVLLVFFVAPVIILVAYPLTENPVFYLTLLWGDSTVWRAIINSTLLALGVTIFSTLLASILAAGFTALPIAKPRILKVLLLAPLIVPPFVGGIGIRKLLSRYGPLNLWLMDIGVIDQPLDLIRGGGIWAIALTEVLHFYPILLLNLLASLERFDARAWEAARLVGASRIATIRRIVLPLIAPSLLASASAVFVWSFADISTPLIFDYRGVLPVQLLELTDELHSNPYGFWVSALILVVTLSWFFLVKNSLSAIQQMNVKGSVVALKEVALKGARFWALCFKTFALVLIIAAITPHLMVVLMSLGHKWWFTPLPTSYSIEPFLMLLSHPITGSAIRNSLTLSTLATVLNLTLAWCGATILLSPKKNWITRSSASLIMTPMAVPGLLVALGSIALFSGTFLDPRNNPIPLLIIGYAIKRLPFSTQTLQAALLTVDRSCIEAAILCGASRFQITTRILLPRIMPFIVSCGVLCFAASMLEVSESFILALKEPYYPITKALYVLLSRPDGERMAAALGVASMLLITLCLGISRYFTKEAKSGGFS